MAQPLRCTELRCKTHPSMVTPHECTLCSCTVHVTLPCALYCLLLPWPSSKLFADTHSIHVPGLPPVTSTVSGSEQTSMGRALFSSLPYNPSLTTTWKISQKKKGNGNLHDHFKSSTSTKSSHHIQLVEVVIWGK